MEDARSNAKDIFNQDDDGTLCNFIMPGQKPKSREAMKVNESAQDLINGSNRRNHVKN